MVAQAGGAICEHGKQLMAETFSAVLATPPPAPREPRQAPATVPVPAALQRYQVETTPGRSLRRAAGGRRLMSDPETR